MIGNFKNGLVLEGGGSRAIYTSGVLDAFLENDIHFEYAIGVSAGSCNAVSFIGKNKRRQHDITVNYVNDKRYMGVGSLIKNGEYLNSNWIFNELSYDLMPLNEEEFENSGTTCCIVTTNAKTGKAEYFYPRDFRERGCKIIRASCSLPIATKGCEIDGEVYFDGGLVDSIPIAKALDDGCQKTITILTQHRGFVKKPMNENVKKLSKKYPNIGKTMVERHNMYNNQLKFLYEMEDEGKTLVICPSRPLECSTLEKNVTKLERIYQLGYQQGIRSIDKVKDYLNG